MVVKIMLVLVANKRFTNKGAAPHSALARAHIYIYSVNEEASHAYNKQPNRQSIANGW